MKSSNIRWRFFGCCVAAASLAVFLGCGCESWFEKSCTPDDNAGMSCTLNLSIAAGSFSSRVGNASGEAAPFSENFINTEANDYRIFVLDGDGRVLQPFKPTSVRLSEEAGESVYKMQGTVSPAPEILRLMVLANWKTAFSGDYDWLDQQNPPTLEELYKDRNNFNFMLPTGNGVSWVPSAGLEGIPMFGLSESYQVYAEGAAGTAGFVPELDVRRIPLLRSLVKIEIVDMVPNGSANIERCVLTSYNKNGRFIPDATLNPDWNKDMTQVITPSLPQSVTTGSNLQFETTKRKVTIDGSLIEKDCFVVYIPEMDLIRLSADDKPVLKIHIKDVEQPYNVFLSPYNKEDGKPVLKEDGSVAYYDGLLRNHVYRYNINSVGIDAKLELLIDTEYWDNDEEEYYYDDIEVCFSERGNFKWNWDRDNVDPLDPFFSSWEWPDDEAHSRENIFSWSDEVLAQWNGKNLVVEKSGASAAEAAFTIVKPERGTWTLALYCAEGTPKHWFQIEIWDEASQKWVLKDQRIDSDEHNLIADTLTGDIAPKGEASKEVRIRISAQDLQYSEGPYSARLVMNVTTFDGRMAEVNLMTGQLMQPSEGSSDDYYYIKQYPTPTE